jgi:hypothetical protein
MTKTKCLICGSPITSHSKLVQVKDAKGYYVDTCLRCWSKDLLYWQRIEAYNKKTYGNKTK